MGGGRDMFWGRVFFWAAAVAAFDVPYSVCVITVRPSHVWCEFLNGFKHYSPVVVVDDNRVDISEWSAVYPNVEFFQAPPEDCAKHNITGVGYRDRITGWDKAVYYYTVLNPGFEQIWLFESDVFFYDETTLEAIDIAPRTVDADLLSSWTSQNDTKWWYWPKLKVGFPPPWFNGMVCALRVSGRLMAAVGDYAGRYGELFFVEALFSTIAHHERMKCVRPRQFENIVYRRLYSLRDLSTTGLYHPVKNPDHQRDFREGLRRREAGDVAWPVGPDPGADPGFFSRLR